jgi:hypothetical protein
MHLSGKPALVRCDPKIDFDWGAGSPGMGIGVDAFSVRWSGQIPFATKGSYGFSATTDDGFRLYLDGVKILDHWMDQSTTTYTIDHAVSAGTHLVAMDYYENAGGAVAKLAIQEGGAPVLASWNPHTTCTPVLTTMAEIIGSDVNASGGALEAGGGFQPHLAGSADRHLLDPPCSLSGTPTFVELHDVVVDSFGGPSGDGDWTGSIHDPNRPDLPTNLKSMHAEIDREWIKAGVDPDKPLPAGAHVDIQGFVYWDPGHVTETWHFYSGWEIHAIAAWHTH